MKRETVRLASVDSTNDYALKLIEKGACEEGLVVLADEQKAGKGHAENSWESEKGKNLTFSLVLKPFFIEPANQLLITQIVSVAILKFLQRFLPAELVKIKWPNDIYVQDKKIAGILIQNTIRGPKLDYSIVGIGLNVNQKVFFSDAPNPVSVIYYTGFEHDLGEMLDKLLVEITNVYTNSVSGSFVDSLNKFYIKSLYRFNLWSWYKANNSEFEGMITGIGDYGKLKMKLKNGEVVEFDFKEVEFL